MQSECAASVHRRDGVVDLQSDDVKLAYTIYEPRPGAGSNNLAVIAHPLGRLGGSRRDHVVVAVAKTLVSEGYTVVTYDSRGSGKSTGNPSFSLVPEAHDYERIVESVLWPLTDSESSATVLSLVLVGYSAGSLACSKAFSEGAKLPPFPARLESARVSRRIRIRRVLISYPLGVLWALTLFRSQPFISALDRVVRGDSEDSHSSDSSEQARAATTDEPTLNASNEVLAIWGASDQFTSATRYAQWSQRLEGLARRGEARRWRGLEVDDADHFWRDLAAKETLLQAVRDFVRD